MASDFQCAAHGAKSREAAPIRTTRFIPLLPLTQGSQDMSTAAVRPEIEDAPIAPVPRTNILGVGISLINMDDALAVSDALICSNERNYICITDVHTVIEAQADPQFRAILNNSFMTTPDGMPLVWVGKIRGHSGIRRVYGPDYLMAICGVSVRRGYRHFLYGGKAGVAERLAVRLLEQFPGLEICGTYTPAFRPLTPSEEVELEERVARAKPDIFWVGLGSPKQERFMAKYCGRLDTKLMVGVGAAFDIHAGIVKEAPRWMKSAGLQWLHRLVQEPRRLWKRYLICIPSFLWMITLQLLGIRRFDIKGDPAATRSSPGRPAKYLVEE
jgi:N-acetylglucosaminyldiphosphoundecaprenol N-acetyl-beta-D-mannosaminyltransferase